MNKLRASSRRPGIVSAHNQAQYGDDRREIVRSAVPNALNARSASPRTPDGLLPASDYMRLADTFRIGFRVSGMCRHANFDGSPRLECDLTGPGYELDGQVRIQLESKVEMKERGVDSPDDADALALTFARNVVPRTVARPSRSLTRAAKGIKRA